MIRKSCSVKGSPASTQTQFTILQQCLCTPQQLNLLRFKSICISHLPLESVVLTIVVPMDSINISATPSLSFILKHTAHGVTSHQTSVCLSVKTGIGTTILSYTAQCSGLKELPFIFLSTSWSNNTSTQASYPGQRRGKKCKGRNRFKHYVVVASFRTDMFVRCDPVPL